MPQWDAEAIKELRGAVYRGDGPVIVEVLRNRLTDETLQMAGDGLLDAVAQQVPEATELAVQCEAALRDRGWDGDEELADQLAAVLNRGPTPMLRPLPVELDFLTDLLEGDPVHGGGRINLTTGECWPADLEFDDEDDADDDDEGRWLYVESEGSRASYHDMERFINSIEDPTIVDRLSIAIQGKRAFRRFKDVLSRWPDEFGRYMVYSDECKRGRARAWLAEAGYRPVRAAKP